MVTLRNRLIKISPDGSRRIISNLVLSDGCGVAVLPNGVIYASDIQNHIILKLVEGNPTPITFVGARGQSGYVDGLGNSARFNQPSQMAVDASGNIYVVDLGNNAIRKINDAGKVTTLTRLISTDPDDTVGNMSIDLNGNIYTFDTYNTDSFPHTIFQETFEDLVTDSSYEDVNDFTGSLPLGLNEVFASAPLAAPVLRGETLFRGVESVSVLSLNPVGTYTVSTDAAKDGNKSLRLYVPEQSGTSTQVFGRLFYFDDYINKVRLKADIRVERTIRGGPLAIASIGEFFGGMVSFVGEGNLENTHPGGIIFQNLEHSKGVYLGIDYEIGRWYNVSLEFDKIQKLVNVFIDGDHSGEFTYRNKVDTFAMMQTFDNDNEALMFVDNIIIQQLA